MFLFLLVLGAAGLVVMAFSGALHLGHHHGHAAAHGHHHHHGAPSGHGFPASVTHMLWSLTSPRTLFTLCVGFGATGALLGSKLSLAPTVGIALVGAVVFEAAVVRPLWNRLLGFGSRPALTLESAVSDMAHAVSGFDANGRGVVALELDGQLVQVLATLRPEDRERLIRVRAGDPVRIEEVDPARNSCIVSVPYRG